MDSTGSRHRDSEWQGDSQPASKSTIRDTHTDLQGDIQTQGHTDTETHRGGRGRGAHRVLPAPTQRPCSSQHRALNPPASRRSQQAATCQCVDAHDTSLSIIEDPQCPGCELSYKAPTHRVLEEGSSRWARAADAACTTHMGRVSAQIVGQFSHPSAERDLKLLIFHDTGHKGLMPGVSRIHRRG